MKLLAIDEQKSQAYESNLKPKNDRTSYFYARNNFFWLQYKTKV